MTDICFVWGLYFGFFANLIAPLLSSKVVVYELHEPNFTPNTLDTYNIICLNGIRSLMLWLIQIYSDSVVTKSISVCILPTQTIGKFANLIIYPFLDRTDSTWSASSLNHDPAKSASAQHSIPFDLSGVKTKPLHPIDQMG